VSYDPSRRPVADKGQLQGVVSIVLRGSSRGMCVSFSGSLLLLAMVGYALAAEKIKIEIVEATNIIQTLDVAVPCSPEQSVTHCAATAVGNTTTSDCAITVAPATRTGTRLVPHLLFTAKAILPDGSHASITCLSGTRTVPESRQWLVRNLP